MKNRFFTRKDGAILVGISVFTCCVLISMFSAVTNMLALWAIGAVLSVIVACLYLQIATDMDERKMAVDNLISNIKRALESEEYGDLILEYSYGRYSFEVAMRISFDERREETGVEFLGDKETYLKRTNICAEILDVTAWYEDEEVFMREVHSLVGDTINL